MKKQHVRQVHPLEIIYFGQYKINLDDDEDDYDDDDDDDETMKIQIFRFLEKTCCGYCKSANFRENSQIA